MTSSYGITFTMRAVLAATVACGALLALVNCGATSDASAYGPSGDGGVAEDGASDVAVGSDGGATDASASFGTTLLVHASPDLFDFRVCFGASATQDGANVTFADHKPWPWDDSHPMAMSNYAAVAVGGGVAVPRELIPQSTFIIAYLINASRVATDGKTDTLCADRVGPACSGLHCFTAGTDYVQLPAIYGVALQHSAAHVLAIAGCKSASGAKCGTEMAGTLHGEVVDLSPQGQQSADQVGVQLAQLSPAAGSVVATFDDTLNDAGPVTVGYRQVGPTNGVIVNRPTTQGDVLWGTEGVAIGTTIDGGVALRMSLADVQRVSDPSILPYDFFAPGGSYVFALVGDPNAANALYADGGLNPKFDGTAIHIVAISTSAPPALDAGE